MSMPLCGRLELGTLKQVLAVELDLVMDLELALKPSAIHKLQASIAGAASSLMTKLGKTSETTSSQTEIEDQPTQSPASHKKNVDTEAPYKTSSASPLDTRTFGTRTEKVINSFLENPILKQQGTTAHERQGNFCQYIYVANSHFVESPQRERYSYPPDQSLWS